MEEPQESQNKKMHQRNFELTVTLPSSTPIIGLQFTPVVDFRSQSQQHSLEFIWYRLLNDKQVNCHVHNLDKAMVQCKSCVRLNLPIEETYFCSFECYCKWKSHPKRHVVDDQNQEDCSYDLQNLQLGSGKAIELDQENNFWLKVGSFKTYVPSKDDFGCILRFSTLVVDERLVLKEHAVVTDRVIKVPPTHPRIMNRTEPFLGADSDIDHTRFRVLSYNILADMHVTGKEVYSYCPTWSLDWEYRRENLVREIIAYDADILCLQEVQLDHFENDLKYEFERNGYSVIYKARQPTAYTKEGSKAYGCATFYRANKYRKIEKLDKLLDFPSIAQKLLDKIHPDKQADVRRRLLKDNVAILTILEPVKTKTASDKREYMLCVVNTHICASEQLKDVKLWQVATLLKEVENVVGIHVPVLLCGDLNSLPKSAPYDLVVHGEVDRNHPQFPKDDIGIFEPKLSHNLSLVSANSKMNSENGNPQFTHFSRNLQATLDYIFYQEDKLVLTGVLEPLQLNHYLPSTQWSSDHSAVMADFKFAETDKKAAFQQGLHMEASRH